MAPVIHATCTLFRFLVLSTLLCLSIGTAGLAQNKKAPGGRIVFWSSAATTFALKSLATGEVRPLNASGHDPALSPDGRLLAYRDSNDKIRILDIESGTDRVLTADTVHDEYGSPAFLSSDTVAYLKSSRSGIGIFSSKVDRWDERPLVTTLPGRIMLPTSTMAAVTGSGEEPSFIICNGSSLFFVSKAGTRTLFSQSDGGESIRYPAVSPDGRQVAFVRDGRSSDIWVMDIAGDAPRQLTADGSSSWPEWSPDGNFIAFLTTAVVLRGTAVKDAANGREVGRTAGSFLFRIALASSDGKEFQFLQAPGSRQLLTHGDRISWK